MRGKGGVDVVGIWGGSECVWGGDGVRLLWMVSLRCGRGGFNGMFIT